MTDWTYVGECQEIKRAAEAVIRALDSGVGLPEATAHLRRLLLLEKRYSWTDDYYDFNQT